MRIAGASDAGNAGPEPDASWWGARSCVAARKSSQRRPMGRAWCGRADGAVPPAPLSSREEN